MENVRFITIEDEEPDLVLSFALDHTERGIKSLILQRTLKYEIFLPENERGVHVSMEGDEDYEYNLLESIKIEKSTITISASRKEYVLSIARIEEVQIKEMRKFIRKLNFDSNFLVHDTKK